MKNITERENLRRIHRPCEYFCERYENGVRTLGAMIAIGIAMLTPSLSASAADERFPSLEQVQQFAAKQFAILSDYESGDLISRDQISPIFDALGRAGWKVADREQILRLVPAADEFLVKELRTSAGKKFMRQSCKYPDAYDRLDRLSRMPMGHQNVDALIAGPDGYKMIQYMTSTSGGRNLGQMLSQDPRGANFNSPTGRIYTADQFLQRLTESYQAELKRRAGNAGT